MSKPAKNEITDAVIFEVRPLFHTTPGELTTVQPRGAKACRIFHGSVAEFDAWEKSLLDEQERKQEEERERAREAARAHEPKHCPKILSPVELSKLRPDPALIEECKNEPAIQEVCGSQWLRSSPESILAPLLDDADLVNVTHRYGSGSTKRFGEIRSRLDDYSSIDLNPLAIGSQPKRKFIVVHFATSYWKRLMHLSRSGEMQLLAAGGNGALFAAFACADWSQKAQKEFAELAIKLGGSLVERMPVPNAPINSLGTTYQFLHSAGFLKNVEELRPRVFTLFARVPNKPELPAVPEKRAKRVKFQRERRKRNGTAR